MADLIDASTWLALGQIVLLDLLLGGDNAVVIAMACRGLPPRQRKLGVIYGTAGAIVLRVVLILFAMTLLDLPYLKFVGGLLLIWIGSKLLVPQADDHHQQEASPAKLWSAVKTVILADLLMSMDNVLAIAAAADGAGQHETYLVMFGLAVSVPIIIGGSQLVLRLMDRFPLVITFGGVLLGWIAGQMMYTDAAWSSYLPHPGPWEYAAGASGALLVLALGWHARRSQAQSGKERWDIPRTAGTNQDGPLDSQP